MALSKHDRKDMLGHGGLTRVAEKRGVTLGHVSQVNSGLRRDVNIEDDIATEISEKHDIPKEDVFGYDAEPTRAAAS